jgi:tetratricopeptide (TPR) repeat protein
VGFRFSIAVGLLAFHILLTPSILQGTSFPQTTTDYAAHSNHGSELIQQSKFHDAVREFREAIRLNSEYLPPHQALIVAYVLTHCFDLAWMEVEYVRHAGADVNNRLVHALASEISEEEASAKRKANTVELATAKDAVAAQGKNALAHGRLSRAYESTGDFPAAQSEAEIALQLDAAQPEAHLVIGTILITDPPTDEQALPHLKLYLQNVPRIPSSRTDIDLAYELLANYYRHRDRESDALLVLQEGLKFDPDDSHLLNSIAWLYATATDNSVRDPKKALPLAQKAVAITKEKKASILDTLGESFYANGSYDEAIAAEKKAIALLPEYDLFADQLKKFESAERKAASPKP